MDDLDRLAQRMAPILLDQCMAFRDNGLAQAYPLAQMAEDHYHDLFRAAKDILVWWEQDNELMNDSALIVPLRQAIATLEEEWIL